MLPSSTHHFHRHINLHLFPKKYGVVVTENPDLEQYQDFIPVVEPNNIFIHNHFAFLTTPLPDQIPRNLFPWEIRDDHVYLHLHYHHVPADYNWDDSFTLDLFKNHIPPPEILAEIEARYPSENFLDVHTHIHDHGDENGALDSSSTDDDTKDEEDDDEVEGGQEGKEGAGEEGAGQAREEEAKDGDDEEDEDEDYDYENDEEDDGEEDEEEDYYENDEEDDGEEDDGEEVTLGFSNFYIN